MRYRAYIFFIFLCLSISALADSGKLFTVENNLSSSMINKVYQTRNGEIWIATEDGLNKYDGVKFSTYKHHPNDRYSLNNNFVRTLFEDSKGHLYIGTPSGLQVYDRAYDRFVTIPLVPKASGEIGVNSLIERKSGEVLVGTSGMGLYSVHYKDNRVSAVHKNYSFIKLDNTISFLHEDKAGNLWIVTSNQGVIRLNKNNRYNVFAINKMTKDVIYNDICEDAKGNVYLGILNEGLYVFRPNSSCFVSAITSSQSDIAISALSVANNHEIYVGTDNEGLKIYDTVTGRITDSGINPTTFDFGKAKIHSMIKDRQGNFWLGLYQKGVLFLPVNTNKFNYIGYKSVAKNMIGSNAVMSIHKDHNGTLWVGTDNDGLYGINSSGKRIAHFVYKKNLSSVPSVIMAIFEDSNHAIWLGSFLNGMCKLNTANGSCDYHSQVLNESSHPISFVRCFAEDRNKNLWIGTMGNGLYCMNLNTHQITCWNTGADKHKRGNVLSNMWVSSLFVSNDGKKLYVGTCNGLNCIDLRTMNYDMNASACVAHSTINALYEDRSAQLWIATADGLLCYIPSKKHVVRYTAKNGLPGDVICSVVGDRIGNLWISTNNGISRFNQKSNLFTNYYAGDGLQGNEFSKNASSIDSNGIITFGEVNGITYFNPQEIGSRNRRTDIRITAIYVHNEAVKRGMKSGSYEIVDTDVTNADKIHLSYQDNSFSIEISNMDFNDRDRVAYMYKLNDGKWIMLQPGTSLITFSNLSPGTYKFQVKSQQDSISSDVKELTIVISPPWYASAWAKILYFLIFISILYFIRSLMQRRKKTRLEILEHVHAEQINEAKLQFFTNISHEIRTPMSLIISPLQKLITSSSVISIEERQKYYQVIYRNSERILRLINQLLDTRKVDKGQMVLRFSEIDIVDFIKDICSYFDFQVKAKKIQMNFEHEEEKMMAWVDPKNFDKIIFNLLSNAVKYTPTSGQIDISLHTGEDEAQSSSLHHYFEIVVSNTGNTIDEKEMNRIFERFYQIQNAQTNSNIGSGIGLHLTRSLVLLHHGTIKACNNEDNNGCRFIIRIPYGKEHLKPEEIVDVSLKPEVTKDEDENIAPESAVKMPAEDIHAKPKSKHKILIVEDDDEIRRYICDELSSYFYMQECANGKEALALILKKAPDLVISDIMMPEMDGITLCRKIKQNVNVNSLPVILLTAKTREQDNMEGLNVGADAYITKPFNIDILMKTADNLIHSREMLRNLYSGSQEQVEKMPIYELQSSDSKLLDRIMNVVNHNLSNPEMNVEMIAKEVGLSRVHLYRKLKELTNQSPRDFIRNVRLRQAATLLASKQYNVSEVTSLTGFSDVAVFSRAFKELYGVTPSAYANENYKSDVVDKDFS